MAEYGVEIRDADGNVMLDNNLLTQRLWHTGSYSNTAVVNYAQSLTHEPTIFAIGINGRGAPIRHRKSGARYIGFEVKPPQRGTANQNLVVVFARE